MIYKTYKELFEDIHKKLKIALENSKKNNDYFLNACAIFSEVETEQNKNEDRPFPRNIKKQIEELLKDFNNEIGYYRDGDIYYFSNDLENVKKHNENPPLKIQFIHQKPPVKERNLELFYYDMRNSDIDNGYTIEQNVLVNNIGSLVANQDLLKGKEYITDEEFTKLDYQEVDDLYIENEEELEM